jgi:hypothetical protein
VFVNSISISFEIVILIWNNNQRRRTFYWNILKLICLRVCLSICLSFLLAMNFPFCILFVWLCRDVNCLIFFYFLLSFFVCISIFVVLKCLVNSFFQKLTVFRPLCANNFLLSFFRSVSVYHLFVGFPSSLQTVAINYSSYMQKS